MNSIKANYLKRVQDISEKAAHMHEFCLEPIVDKSTGSFIQDDGARREALKAVTSHSIFESAGKGGPMIQTAFANALRSYCMQRGCTPSDELMAAAYNSLSNAIQITSKKSGLDLPSGSIFESATMDTTEGIIMRDRLIALILPVLLLSITSDMVTFIPGTFNQSEIFRIRRVAGSTFGDLTKGDIIGQTFNGQYSCMDQRYATGTGDGTDTGSSNEFRLRSTEDIGVKMPFKRKSVRILHDRNIVAADDGEGNIYGSFLVGVTTVTVTGTVDYANGVTVPLFSVAPALGIEIHTMVDIDIEADPTLIPLVTHEMDSKVLYPHESSIAGDTTLQAFWALRREFNLNANNMTMSAMRNLLSADKDRKHLRDMYFFAKDERSWDMDVPTQLYYQEWYETMRIKLLEIDQALLARTEISGLVGLVADPKSSVVFRSLKEPFFTPAAGYRRVPQPHYVGTLFGMWSLYEDPNGTDYTSLCFAKGKDHGQAGYVAGDAIPAMSFKHAMDRSLTYKDTLWELAYRDVHPFGGREYFMNFRMTTG
jgi:hypothetical protein